MKKKKYMTVDTLSIPAKKFGQGSINDILLEIVGYFTYFSSLSDVVIKKNMLCT